MKKFGWTNPILVDADDRVIAGHARAAYRTEPGMKEAPVLPEDRMPPTI
jgi:hypothetical protein